MLRESERERYPYPFLPHPLLSRFLFPVLCSCSSGKTLWGFVYLFVLVLRRGRERETAEVGRDSHRLPKRGERDWLPFKICRRICVTGKSDSTFTPVPQNWLWNCSFPTFALNGLLKMKTRKMFPFPGFVTGKESRNHRSMQVLQTQVEPSLTGELI